MADGCEVMADEQHGEAHAPLQVPERGQERRPDRHVESRGDLVGDEYRRIDGERTGDGHALALAARELPRHPVGAAGVETDQFQQSADALFAAAAVQPDEGPGRFGERLTDRHAGVECRVRVLENQLDLLAQPASTDRPAASVLPSADRDPPGARAVQPDDRTCQSGLSRTGLADQADRRAPGNLQ